SSRRRHTRSTRDWSSDVCSSDLDQGFEPARKFIHDWLLSEAREIAADKRHTNYKSHLQEYVQSTFRTHPVYRIRSEIGPDHSKQIGRASCRGRARRQQNAS